MENALVQATLRRTTGVPADAVVNTFHFQCDSDVASEVDLLYGRISAFYHPNWWTFMSPALSGSIDVKIYRMDDPKPRQPLHEGAINNQNTGDSSRALPGEIALCLSYHAGVVSGTNPKRRRGRIYTGPFNLSALASTVTGGDARPSSAVMFELGNRGKVLMDQSTSPYWSVYSHADGGSYQIQQISVDDAWDSQRRRGAEPTVRTVIPRTVFGMLPP